MTKDQEEALEKLNRIKNIKRGPENRMGMIIEEFKSLQNDIEIVLNLLKEKDEEIEKYKNLLVSNLARNLNDSIKAKDKADTDLEDLDRGWQVELEKKDAEIEKYKQLYNKALDDAVKTSHDNIKKDKEIEFQKDINKQEKDRHKQAEKSLKGQIKKLKTDFKIVDQECSRLERKEEKQDKIIDLMAEHIVSSAIVDDTICAIKCDCETDINEDCTHEKMLKCTKQYFERKATNDG